MHKSKLLLSVLLIGSIGLASSSIPVYADAGSVAEIKKSANENSAVIIEQFYLGCLSHASYLIADPVSKNAVIVDPQRDINQYLDEAKKQGLKITHVFLTHVHADFVAGHLELQRKVGAHICLGEGTKANYDFKTCKDGDTISLGENTALKVLSTPGHTPEAISILVYDLKSNKEKPYAVLTGDCLFIGDVGRPDLLASQGVTANQLAGMLYDSLRSKLMPLPDETLVYPAHGAGSLCGKNMSKDTISSIGRERKTNYALQDMTKEKFITLITADQPQMPKYFGYDANVNLSKHDTLDEVLMRSLKPLTVDEAIQQKNAGAYILDGRESDQFAAGHIVDSISIPMNGHYATWAGTFLNHEKPVVIVADAGKEREAALRLGRIGFDRVVGYVKDGMSAFGERADLVAKNTRETAETLETSLKSGKPPIVVDVRNDSEWNSGQIDGSLHVPLINLLERADSLPRDRQLVILCATGNRSSTAASLLSQRGVTQVTDLRGGIEGWKKLNLPVKQTVSASTKAECKVPTDENTSKRDGKN